MGSAAAMYLVRDVSYGGIALTKSDLFDCLVSVYGDTSDKTMYQWSRAILKPTKFIFAERDRFTTKPLF
jgi:hypothetical protein